MQRLPVAMFGVISLRPARACWQMLRRQEALPPKAVFEGKMFGIAAPADRGDCSDVTLQSTHGFLDGANVSCVDGENSVTTFPFYRPRLDAGAAIHSARSISPQYCWPPRHRWTRVCFGF